MRGRMLFGLTGAALGLLGACAYEPTVADTGYDLVFKLPAVRVMEPQGPFFNRGLREGYLSYSDVVGGDYPDHYHFALKAVDSAEGELVMPDLVESRWLAETRAQELAAARARLLAALEQTGREKAPLPAAEAQVAFDCWLEQAEWGADDELTCKQRFEKAIAEVERALVTEENVYLVFFAWDQADLTPVTRAVLDQVVEDYRRDRPTRIVIAGHADRSGTEAYNEQLSERRARNVARALVERGIAERALDVRWFGERRPRIATPDGAREPRNRRVEITFGEAGPAV